MSPSTSEYLCGPCYVTSSLSGTHTATACLPKPRRNGFSCRAWQLPAFVTPELFDAQRGLSSCDACSDAACGGCDSHQFPALIVRGDSLGELRLHLLGNASDKISNDGEEFGAPTEVPGSSDASVCSSSERAGDSACSGTKCEECGTTFMLRNLPESFTRSRLEELLDSEGFTRQYDFIYMPADLSSGACFGYAFINMVSLSSAKACMKHFEGFARWPVPSTRRAVAHMSENLQGLAQMVERYRNSPLMHPSVPDAVRPAVYVDGSRAPFPDPTEVVRPPRRRKAKLADHLVLNSSVDAHIDSTHGHDHITDDAVHEESLGELRLCLLGDSSNKDIIGSEPTEVPSSSCTEIPSSSCSSILSRRSSKGAEEGKTTLMIRNLPESFTRSKLEELLNAEGFAEQYNFLYLPTDLSSGVCFGYAFVNMVTPSSAKSFMQHFQGFRHWPVPSIRCAEVHMSDPLQGLAQMVERYRNSPLMHPSVPDAVRPAMYVNGSRVPMPEPTEVLKRPRTRKGRKQTGSDAGLR